MPRLLRPCIDRSARRLLLCCLLLALPVYGLSGRVVELLGHQHLHAPLAQAGIDPMAGWQDFRRIAPGASEAGHGHHHHAAAERHHHAHDDASVIALDAAAQGEGAAGEAGATPAGSAALVFVLGGMPAQHADQAAGHGWRAWQPGPMKHRDGERLERPPRG